MRRTNWFLFSSFFALAACADGIGPAPADDLREAEQELTPDGVPDRFDNCPADYNPPDVNLGLVCVTASDCVGGPGLLANGQPIPVATNPWTSPPTSSIVGVFCVAAQCRTQSDADLDGGGDMCDMDDDNDGRLDTADNCPTTPNADQDNNDGDAQGDACDTDDDNDGDLDGADNCPFVANPDQLDTDTDGIGDACEGDLDGDGIGDDDDNCPTTPNADQDNNDGDAQGDACDTDDDNDGDLDGADNCPFVANPDQANADGDAEGDLCDTDVDNDTVINEEDNCPMNPNLAQTDSDEDGSGDACDTDDDNDGDLDGADNCPVHPNPDQANKDCDPANVARGSVCDTLGNVCDLDCDGDGTNEVTALPNVCAADIDGDGSLPPADCNEGNGSIRPGATETCDLIDQDCDGAVDEGLTCPNACDNAADCAVVGGACIAGICQAGECTVAGDCNDELFCTGVETCTSGACVAGSNPCGVGTTCNETTNTCDGPTTTCPAGQFLLLGLCVDVPPPGSCSPFAVTNAGTLSGGTQFYAEFYAAFGSTPVRSGNVNNGVLRSTPEECSVVVSAPAPGATCTCTTSLGSSPCTALPRGGFGCSHNQPPGL